MATTNPIIAPTWTALVTAGDDFFLTLGQAAVAVEIAVSDTDTAPNVGGHLILPATPFGHPKASLNRRSIGPGYVYARSIEVAVPVTLTTWPAEIVLPEAALLPNGTMLQVINGHWEILLP